MVFNSVERKEGVNNGRNVFGLKNINDSGVVCNGVDKECSCVVAYNVGRDSVVVVLENDKTTCEGWKEGESG